MAINNFFFIIFFFILVFILAFIQIFRNRVIYRNCLDCDRKLAFVQLAIIFISSILFVGYADWRFALCLVLTSIFTYVMGWVVGNSSRKKLFLIISVIVLLSVLGFFKYTNFFINSFLHILGFDGVIFNIILPVGISFYILTAISYLIDVYHGINDAENNLFTFMLFMTFFPKITSGPIIRGSEMFPQIKNYKGVKFDSFLVGIQIFVFGLFKKIVLADRLGIFVNDVWHAPTAFSTGTVILGVISFSFQIYFDFSGYSDMAIGLSKILGFEFSKNFNLPYLATNISDFWKRWHISLSSWLRDYLYFPLGGSRKGRLRTYFNLFIVMTVSGLWHGASVTFICWGILYGFASCINKLFADLCKKYDCHVRGKLSSVIVKLAKIILTFIFVTLCWIPFRSEDMHKTMLIIKSIFTWHDGIVQPYTWSFFAIICYFIGCIVAYVKKYKIGDTNINGFYFVMNLNNFWGQLWFFVFCGITILLAYFGNTAFIYATF